MHDEIFYDSSLSFIPARLMYSFEQPEGILHCSLRPVCSWDDEALDNTMLSSILLNFTILWHWDLPPYNDSHSHG